VAVVLDWDSVSWAEGTLNNTYQPDGADPDSVVTIGVTPNGAPLVPFSAAPNPTTPVTHNGLQGGLLIPENTLTIAVNLTNPSESVTLTISFAASGGASNVSFSLFDLDAGGGVQDELRSIQALSIDGSTWIAPTITTGPDNTLVGSGLGQVVLGTASTPNTGLTSGRGNVTIDFGANQIQWLTFTFGATDAFADPAYQHFGMHDLNFTPIPEVNPTVLSLLGCAGAVAGFHWRRRRTS
jgi:hypothetical protein